MGGKMVSSSASSAAMSSHPASVAEGSGSDTACDSRALASRRIRAASSTRSPSSSSGPPLLGKLPPRSPVASGRETSSADVDDASPSRLTKGSRLTSASGRARPRTVPAANGLLPPLPLLLPTTATSTAPPLPPSVESEGVRHSAVYCPYEGSPLPLPTQQPASAVAADSMVLVPGAAPTSGGEGGDAGSSTEESALLTIEEEVSLNTMSLS